MHFFGLTLQRAGAINVAINGSFSAPKVQVIHFSFDCRCGQSSEGLNAGAAYLCVCKHPI
jgi:hypothetical protein